MQRLNSGAVRVKFHALFGWKVIAAARWSVWGALSLCMCVFGRGLAFNVSRQQRLSSHNHIPSLVSGRFRSLLIQMAKEIQNSSSSLHMNVHFVLSDATCLLAQQTTSQ